VKAKCYTVQVTWGERLAHHVHRHIKTHDGIDLVDLTTACAAIEPAVHNSYRNLFEYDEIPGRPAPRRRAYILALAIGLDPADLAITVDRPITWADDDTLRELLAGELRSDQVARAAA
jgi:hypothetical protein